MSIVVPVPDGERTVEDCIVSLLRLDYPSDLPEILVVDNGSRDGAARIIRRHPLIYLSEIRQWTSACPQTGPETSRGGIVAFTDADCVVDPRWPSAQRTPRSASVCLPSRGGAFPSPSPGV